MRFETKQLIKNLAWLLVPVGMLLGMMLFCAKCGGRI